MNNRDADELLAILAEERACLMEGRLTSLAEIAERKTRLMAQVPTTALSSADISLVATECQRNERLLLSALEGVRAAKARIQALRRVDGTFNCYTSEGRQVRFGRHHNGFEHLA
jgi:flagellar biosynthesis/type III secretory pathway chaperone